LEQSICYIEILQRNINVVHAHPVHIAVTEERVRDVIKASRFCYFPNKSRRFVMYRVYCYQIFHFVGNNPKSSAKNLDTTNSM